MFFDMMVCVSCSVLSLIVRDAKVTINVRPAFIRITEVLTPIPCTVPSRRTEVPLPERLFQRELVKDYARNLLLSMNPRFMDGLAESNNLIIRQ